MLGVGCVVLLPKVVRPALVAFALNGGGAGSSIKLIDPVIDQTGLMVSWPYSCLPS